MNTNIHFASILFCSFWIRKFSDIFIENSKKKIDINLFFLDICAVYEIL